MKKMIEAWREYNKSKGTKISNSLPGLVDAFSFADMVNLVDHAKAKLKASILLFLTRFAQMCLLIDFIKKEKLTTIFCNSY